jgi:AraC family transcriptional regulator
LKVSERGVLSGSELFVHTPSQTALRLYFYVELIGHYLCDKSYCVSRGRFRGFLLFYVLSGRAVAEAAGNEYELFPGDALLIDTTRPHIYAARGPLEVVWMHFDGPLAREYHELLSAGGHVHTPADAPLFESLFKELLQSFQAQKPSHEALASSVIAQLLGLLIFGEENSGRSRPSSIQAAIQYVENHYAENISLEELAAQACLSPYHFSRRFRQETGYSPHRFILETRLSVARHLLRRSQHSIKEIAYKTGFSSESHFVSVFKQKFGLTPGKYRLEEGS